MELRQYSPALTTWFWSVHVCADLIQFLLQNRSFLPGNLEGLHFRNGCMQAWELALFGR